MHLTFLFLGDKPKEELNSIKDSLSGIGSKMKDINKFHSTEILYSRISDASPTSC